MTLSTKVLTSNGVGHVRLLIEFPKLAQDLEPVTAVCGTQRARRAGGKTAHRKVGAGQSLSA